MTSRMQEWVRLPTRWIQDGGLKAFRWEPGIGANNISALMCLIAIAHRADETGTATITYDTLTAATQLSRAKVAAGLDVLEEYELIERWSGGRSRYVLSDFDLTRDWAKLPARKLYSGDVIAAFSDFKLRSIAELNALKLYLLFVTRRGNDTNLANISYDKITAYSGVDRPRIKQALTMLAATNLAHIERIASTVSAAGVSNAYRLAHLDPYAHMGTLGRNMDANEIPF
jgi:hypothetical protein